jgi:biotin synthase-related radical SAM superfamily protein
LKNVVSFVRKVRNKGVDLPIAVEFEPTKQYEYLEELKSLGVETVSCNIEMLQNDIRPLLMPGKGLISIDEYYRTWEKCVALFGESQVYTNVLLNSIEYNRNNIINQLRTITSIGVIPSLGLLIPEKGTELENIKLPDIEQQYEYHFYNNAYIQSNKLNPLNAKAGCPRNGAYSPVKEFYVDSLYQDRCIVQQCKTNN